MSSSNVDPMKKSSIYATFGRYYGEKLYKLLFDCCSGLPGSFCYEVLKCLGISPQGDNSKFLNQQGSWEYVSGSEPIEVTYTELLNLISTNTLIAGRQYLITDFQTAHYIQFSDNIGDEEIHTGAIEPMLVQAVSSSELATEIWSTVYPTDKITWKPIFNDRDYDAVLGQSTGVITSRYDTLLKLYRDYDWRNVIFRRWETVSGSGDYNNYTDTGFAFQDFTPFNLILGAFDVSVGSGLELGQIGLGLPYQLDNVVFQLDCVVSKVSLGAASTFQEIFAVNNIDILLDQLCLLEFTNNNIKYVQSNLFEGDVRNNTLMELSSNDISDDFLGNIGVSFVENQINGAFEDNNFSFLYQNVVTGDIFQNLFMTAIENKTFTSTAGMQVFSPSVTLLDAVDGDVEQILSGGTLSYVTF
jgi:hypothetical protein